MRLFPPAELRDHGSGRLQPSDDLWKLTAVNPPRSITLVNGRSGQEIVLAPDHVHHFTSSSPADTSCAGTLELTMRVDLTGELPTISPIPSGPARVNAVTLHLSPAEVRRSWFAEHPSQVSLASPSASSLPAALPGRSMMHSKPRPSRRSGEKLRLSSKRRSGTLQLSAKRRLGRRKKR